MKDTFCKILDAGEFEGHTYDVISQPLSWSDAQLFCNSRDSELVWITSQPENDFVKQLVVKELRCDTDRLSEYMQLTDCACVLSRFCTSPKNADNNVFVTFFS